MLATITILTSFLFATLYPLCFWISSKDPLKNAFHRFHLGLPTIVANVTTFFIIFKPIPVDIKVALIIWSIFLIGVLSYYWQKGSPHPSIVTLPCLIGLYGLIRWESHVIDSSVVFHLASLLSGLILCSSLYAMNLGHWYLNVHGLAISHLTRAAIVFGCVLVLRVFWDTGYLLFGNVFYAEEKISVLQFLSSLDGFLLCLGVLFGTLLPFIALLFAQETIRLKNTQSSTGILYVILCSLLIGDITYKYYFIKFHVFL